MYRLKEAGLGFSLVDNFKWLLYVVLPDLFNLPLRLLARR
jgi:hypothetical protein